MRITQFYGAHYRVSAVDGFDTAKKEQQQQKQVQKEWR